MNIAVFVSQHYGGSGLYRLLLPHEKLKSWGVKVMFSDSTDPATYKGCDLFVSSKFFFVHVNGMIPILRRMGIKTIIDYDDYWVLPQGHYLYHSYKVQNTTKILCDGLRLYDHVTCTTPRLATEIAKINKNVEVFENAIDPNNEQFFVRETKSDRVRFGWIGGHCHLPDIELLHGTPQKLTGDFEVNLFGHDLRPNSVYDKFGKIVSADGLLVKQKKFRAHAATTARRYTQFYNLIDVALAPLVGDKFNSMKSELKMVEAGFMRKALIVSDVHPYSDLINKKNCLSCSTKTHWAKNMQRLIKNPSMCEDLAESLYETVKDKYDLDNVTRRRLDWYKTLI